MFFQRSKTPGIAHASYMIGRRGDVAVVDPRRDIDEYLRLARQHDLTISHVVETHRQEDFVLGSAELARVTGAKVVNGTHELFGHGDIRLNHRQELTIAGLRFRALHTPGHTPEAPATPCSSRTRQLRRGPMSHRVQGVRRSHPG